MKSNKDMGSQCNNCCSRSFFEKFEHFVVFFFCKLNIFKTACVWLEQKGSSLLISLQTGVGLHCTRKTFLLKVNIAPGGGVALNPNEMVINGT